MARPKSLPLTLILDAQPVGSSTTARHAGAYVLVIATAIGRPDLALTLTSSYIGAGRVRTHVTHLQHGPAGASPTIETIVLHDGHEEEASKPLYRPGECLDDHAQRLLEWLKALGHDVRIDIGDDITARLQVVV